MLSREVEQAHRVQYGVEQETLHLSALQGLTERSSRGSTASREGEREDDEPEPEGISEEEEELYTRLTRDLRETVHFYKIRVKVGYWDACVNIRLIGWSSPALRKYVSSNCILRCY